MQFNLSAELEKALQYILTDLAKQRAEMEAKEDTKDRWYAKLCYTTATDLERRVRAAAAEIFDGVPYGEYQYNGYSVNAEIRISGLNGYSLLEHCRRFLLRHPGLTSHNFGRGHVSGQRFRPVGLGLSESEQRTIAAKQKEKPVHFKRETSWAPACIAPKPRGRFSGRPSASTARVTKDPCEVTCPRCRKLLTAEVPAVASPSDAVRDGLVGSDGQP